MIISVFSKMMNRTYTLKDKTKSLEIIIIFQISKLNIISTGHNYDFFAMQDKQIA